MRRGARLRSRLAADPQAAPADVAYSLATTRAALRHRAAVVTGDRAELLAGLDGLAAGREAPGVLRGREQEGTTVFLFPGQGSQYPGMGRELYEAFPSFAVALDTVCDAFRPHLEQPLRDVLFADRGSRAAESLDSTAFTQPALFAVEVALFRLLEGWGLVPDHLSGHSVGEITAAHVAGVWPLAEAAELVAARGRLMRQVMADGAMAALEATESEVTALLAGRTDRVAVAAVNGPKSVVVSGDRADVLDVAGQVEAQGRRVKRLRVSHAFHSPHMDTITGEFRRVAARLTAAPSRVPLVSTLTGRPATASQLADPDYWVRQAREAVRFHDAVRRLAGTGATRWVEVGPGTALTAMAQETTADTRAQQTHVDLLRPDRPETRTLTTALARLHLCGAARTGPRSTPGPAPAASTCPPTPSIERATGCPTARPPQRAEGPPQRAERSTTRLRCTASNGCPLRPLRLPSATAWSSAGKADRRRNCAEPVSRYARRRISPRRPGPPTWSYCPPR